MFLKSIILRGFKSFGPKKSLIFEPGICIIVGPNGSGKSNIVDAISWVLGEQSPKLLRSSSMGDIIFKSKNEELAIAEVSLIFDNVDKVIPIEFLEVKFTRRMYLRGGSEYFINSSPVRLSDIQDLISQSGIGKGLYTIINQGQINNIIMYRGIERKQIIDEIIGISRYKIRRDKSKLKLDDVSKDIDRINDLIKEIKRTMDPLEIEAKKSREMNEIISQIKVLELSLFITNINNLNSQWDIENKKTIENAKEIADIEEKINELSKSKLVFDREYDMGKEMIANFEEKLSSFNIFLNKLRSLQLVVNNRLISIGTIISMLEFSMKNFSSEKVNYFSELNGEEHEEKLLSILRQLAEQIKECLFILNKLYENIKSTVKSSYFKEVKVELETLNNILSDMKKTISENLNKKEQKEKIQDKDIIKHTSETKEKVIKLDQVKIEVAKITNEVNLLAGLLDRFFKKSLELETRLNSEILNKKNEFNKKLTIYNNFEEKLNILNSKKNFLENDSYRADLKKEQIKEKVKDLTIKIFDDYNLSLDYILKNYSPSKEPIDSERRLQYLKSKLQSYKNINPNAHLEYEKIKERFDFLSNQKTDLVESKKGLEIIINDLNIEIKKFFNEKFQEINENFKFYFKILFPTGKGELIIKESENNQEDEIVIDIIADTGGNKSVSLQLLSGGEKALVSIAFLFAIFAANSSPFYVFDEIDAALDDANLDRFITLVKEFSGNRQIIIISHQKKTMEIADIIYGFSMQSDGITKIVSEKLKALNV